MARLSRYIVAIIVVILAITATTMTHYVTAYSEPAPTTVFTINQSFPKPAVPEFNIQLSNSSSEITLQFKIKNEAFTTYETTESINHSYMVKYYYNIHFRMNSTQNQEWFEPYSLNLGYIERIQGNETLYVVHGQSLQEMGFDFKEWNTLMPRNSTVDIQLQAMIGYFNSTHFNGQLSDWSSTMTVDLNEMTVATPTPSPTVPEFPFLLGLPILLSVLAVALAFRIKKPGYFRNQ